MAKVKTPKQPKDDAPTKPKKLASSWVLLRQTWMELSSFWRTLVGITLVYVVLYVVLVMGLNITSGLSVPVDTGLNRFSQAINSIATSINDVYAQAQSDTTVLVQMLLFVVASLALIWALRKLQALKKITIRDAYYQGSAQIIPVLLVSIVLLLTLIPAVIGSSIFSVVLQTASVGIEILIVSVIAGLLLLLSLLLFSIFWPAYYIASLPQTRPIQALKSAKAITKKRRLSIIRKFLVLGLVLGICGLLFVVPIAIIAPSFASYVVYIALFAGFLYSQVYLYELYRSLL